MNRQPYHASPKQIGYHENVHNLDYLCDKADFPYPTSNFSQVAPHKNETLLMINEQFYKFGPKKHFAGTAI